jgi:hypothetical protein
MFSNASIDTLKTGAVGYCPVSGNKNIGTMINKTTQIYYGL